ncbi:LysM peptidoglycan-binding domain-containing protein [Bradyrhizobium sp. Ai1a-2]|uniref:LysM peptidoglycan-binding domain-containing protein n=1 Tax=Bradyrhizobium sp. Ai1a-2 TaxID=196490 RepID=UPI001FCBB7D1|nr:LysM peptidoglycan-binding domain-containing protein [Bradyrhizobium sp. Ai1a-2]
MSATSISRMVVPILALAVAGVVALFFLVPPAQLMRPVDMNSATATAPAATDPATEKRDPASSTLSALQSEAANLATALTGLPSAPAVSDGTPEFDIVRIEPTGDAVVAGRATPGATVELLRNGEVHDRIVADQSGQFAMIPRPLPPGNYDLTLRVKQPDGKETASRQSVAVALEPSAKEQPIVALIAPDKPVKVLSQDPVPVPGAAAERMIVVEAVETEPGGKLRVSGRARPGAAVRLYLNDSFVAAVTSDDSGRLSVTINAGVAAGNYRIRLDEVEPSSGSVRARAEVPFNVPSALTTASVQAQAKPAEAATTKPQLAAAETTAPPDKGAPSAVVVPKITTATVSRGDSLWRISQRAFGAGQRYAVIYRANKEQIRNPNRIYPGQIFVVPAH